MSLTQSSTVQQALDNNLMVLSNLTELAARVMGKVAGNDAASVIQGERLTSDKTREMVAARLRGVLQPYLKA